MARVRTHRPHLIGIAGQSGSGKTVLAHYLALRLHSRPAPVIPFDAYYRDRSVVPGHTQNRLNFDAPDALDRDLLLDHLSTLAAGQPIERPTYDFTTRARLARTERIRPEPFILAEGLLTLHWEEARALFGTRVFITVDDATCLARRVARDTRERGRTAASVQAQWDATVRPMFERYVAPTRRFATLVIDGADPVEDNVAVILAHIRERVIV